MRNLALKHPQARILSCRGHMDALGYRITREDISPLPGVRRRMRRRLAGYVTGEGDREGLRRSLASSVAVFLFGG